MKKIITGILFVHLISFIFFDLALAQEQEGELYRVETTDNNIFVGTLVSATDEEIVLLTETIGEITIRRENIKRITRIDDSQIREDGIWHENPQRTRYFFAPNALGLKKGHGYYQNTWIFFNNVNYGVTDNFSIGGGTIPLFLFGSGSFPFWIIPKVSIPAGIENLHFGAGALIGGVIGEETGGLFYGNSTYGDSNQNITVGLGYSFGSGGVSSSPVINVSGLVRSSHRIYFISENYFFPTTDFNGLISIGVRWAPENAAIDFALVRPLEVWDSFVAFPWLGVTIPFGQ